MTEHVFVTTFSPDGYKSYGQEFVDTYVEHVAPQGHDLLVYHESQPEVDYHRRLTWVNLDHDPDRKRFIQDHGQDPKKVGTPRDPNSQAIRFCHKIFALVDAAKHTNATWLTWVDADVVWTAPPELELACPTGKSLAFLARPNYRYTECGWVSYRIAAAPVRRLLEDMRHYYTSGEIFTHPASDWHDSRCFDICRERSHIPPHQQHNLSGQTRDIHVWPSSVLSRWSTHNKGPRRKQAAYGSIVP